MPYSYRSSKSSSMASRYSRTKTGQRKSSRNQPGEYIDPSRFIKPAMPAAEAEVYQATNNSFSDFALSDVLQVNLKAKGYDTPSPIQDQAIPVALEGRDIIGIANTGTGKTAAFVLPMLEKLMSKQAMAAIIIAPTRELAQQIEDECRALAKNSGLFGALLIGGTSMSKQIRDLKQRPRIVIGTPGRIKDHLQRGTLRLNQFNIVVLDEVDRMLDMGFVKDVNEILGQASQDRQSLFFSATMDTRVRNIINAYTQDPFIISIKASSASENVNQDVVHFQGPSDKVDKLHDLLLKEEVVKVLVFDDTQRAVERLSKRLIESGFSADAIHGGKTQGQRQRALNKFKNNEISVLVATDVAARGIDVADITHVINFSIPKAYDDYIHRIGRTGRAGQTGHALTFVGR